MKTEKLNIQVLKWAAENGAKYPKIDRMNGTDIGCTRQVSHVDCDGIVHVFRKTQDEESDVRNPSCWQIHTEPQPKPLTKEEAKAEIGKILKGIQIQKGNEEVDSDHGQVSYCNGKLYAWQEALNIIDRMEAGVMLHPAAQTAVKLVADFRIKWMQKADVLSPPAKLDLLNDLGKISAILELGWEPAEDARIEKALELCQSARRFVNAHSVPRGIDKLDAAINILKGKS